MQNNIWKKGLVLGIVMLFVEASVVPSISGNISKMNDVKGVETRIINDVIQVNEEEPHTMSTTDWWPMFHHDLNHSGYSTSTAPNTNSVLWNYSAGGWIHSSPAVAGGFVYIGCFDDKVYCLNETTGSYVWSYQTGDDVASSPAVSGGNIYVGSDDDKLYCLNAATGSYIWSYTTGGDIDSSPAVANGKVYVGSFDGKLYCLNAATGSYVWSYQTGGAIIKSSPAVANGKVYIGSAGNHEIYCLNAVTGSYIWSYEPQPTSFILSSPAVAYDNVYIQSNNGKLYCLATTDGLPIWSYETGGDYSSPAVADGKVYIGSNLGKVYCLNASTGEEIWNSSIGGQFASSPAVADGKVYIQNAGGHLYCLNISDGTTIWNSTTVGGFPSPAVAQGRVYVGTGDSQVVCFGNGGNQPPYPPSNPDPPDGATDVSTNPILSVYVSDPDGDTMDVSFYDAADNSLIDIDTNVASDSRASVTWTGLEENTTYRWYAVADDGENTGHSDTWKFTTGGEGNEPPDAPIISGSTSGKVGRTYSYTFVSKDPDNDDIYYEINWGDGDVDPWDGPHESNTIITRNHSWSEKGTYTIMARAKDVYGAIGEWGTLEVTMPKNKAFSFNLDLLSWLFERFPYALPILRYLLGL